MPEENLPVDRAITFISEKFSQTIHAIDAHESLAKRRFDMYADPIQAGLVIGGMVPIATDAAAEYITHHAVNGGGFLMAAYLGAAAATPILFNRVIKPAARKIHDFHAKRKTVPSRWPSYARSLAFASALTTFVTNPVVDSFKNISYDFDTAFSARSTAAQNSLLSEETALSSSEPSVEPPRPELAIQEGAIPTTPFTYTAGALHGRRVSSPHHKLFTGLEGVVSETGNLNPKENLDRMWRTKKQWLARHGRVMSPAAKVFWDNRVKHYDWSADRRMDINQYMDVVDDVLTTVKNSMNWNALSEVYHLDDDQALLVKQLTTNLTSQQIVSYSLSELNDVRDGSLNLAVYDFMLRNFGLEYISMIPAMYDEYASMGPYQFTSLAVFDANGKKEGASRANQALPPSQRIPGSVVLLTPEQHIEAAVLFAVHNYARFSSRLNRRQRGTLRDNLSQSEDDLAMLLAAMHHAPVNGYNTGERWLDNDAKSPLNISADSRVRDETDKALENYTALRE